MNPIGHGGWFSGTNLLIVSFSDLACKNGFQGKKTPLRFRRSIIFLIHCRYISCTVVFAVVMISMEIAVWEMTLIERSL